MKKLNVSKTIWDGDATLANWIFGESYGVDWQYMPNSADIQVGNRIIKIGEEI